MWLIVYKEDAGWDGETEENRVFAVESAAPPDGAYDLTKFDVKEWDGAVPKLPDYDGEGNLIPGDVDPTLSDPEYAEKVQERLDYENLDQAIEDELDWLATSTDWLETVIPTIDTMTFEELRTHVKKLSNGFLYILGLLRKILKVFRYIIRRRLK